MKSKAPLLEAILEYKSENNVLFSMPGNKSGKAFLKDELGEEFVNNMGYLDITEVEPLDNFHEPEGVISTAQNLLRDYYGVRSAYFLVNGSSSGNLISIFSAFDEGDEVLVERNCHKSIYNAIVLRKLKVTYIDPVIHGNIMLPPNEENIIKAYNLANNPKGIILTSPSYYGISYDFRNTLINLKKKNLKIVIDEAHGAHYKASDKLPDGFYDVADYIVVSAHKTLPALTGGAYLLQNEENDRTRFYISTFITTSPSYLIMASLDYARHYLESYARQDYEKLIEYAQNYKGQINSLNKLKILSSKDLPEGYAIDESRFVLTLDKEYSGEKLLQYFRKKHIQCEMSFKEGVVLILSSVSYKEELAKLKVAIEELDLEEIKDISFISENNPLQKNKKILEPYEVFNYDICECDYDKSEGKVSAGFIAVYPPGIPLINPGEEINKETIEMLDYYIKNNMKVLGINTNKIKFVNL